MRVSVQSLLRTPRPTMRRSQPPTVVMSSPSKIGLKLPFSEPWALPVCRYTYKCTSYGFVIT
jgi:hypothetical protein